MRHGMLDNEEKARAVLCRTGRPGNECACMDEAEHAQLAAIYDECVAPELALKERVDAFWGERIQRLDAAKATDDVGPESKSLFRNSKATRQAAMAAEKEAAEPAPDQKEKSAPG